MRTVTVTWDKGEERFVALGTHPDRSIVINAPHGPGTMTGPTGFSATELLLAGAGACAAWDVVEILRKRRAHVMGLEVTVEGHQEPDPPWTYLRVALHFRVTCDDMRLPVIARVIRLSIVRYCSVITTVAAAAAIEATVELVSADGGTTGRHPIELAIPAVPAPVLAQLDLREVGVPEPTADES
ncbi:MAG: OsmC family protein [Chloroflexota bacterium]